MFGRRWKADKGAEKAGQTFKWRWFWWLRIAALKWKMSLLSCGFLLSRSLSRSWPVDVRLGTEAPHFSYASNFIWMTLSGQGPALALLSISVFVSPIFHSYYKNSPHPRSPGLRPPTPPPFAAVLRIIITHIARFISGWAMQKIKNCNPQKSRTRTLSQNLLLGVKPVSLCEANEQASLLKAALMHESELVNCEKTPSEREA